MGEAMNSLQSVLKLRGLGREAGGLSNKKNHGLSTLESCLGSVAVANRCGSVQSFCTFP